MWRRVASRAGGHRRPRASSPRSLAAARRSPYVVLGVDRDAGAAEVKRAFRERAKDLHPDTRSRGVDGAAADAALGEVLAAYAALSDGAFGTSNLVAASCEIFTIDELRADAYHDVFDVALSLPATLLGGGGPPAGAPSAPPAPEPPIAITIDAVAPGRAVVTLACSPLDAIADVKRALESRCAGEWNLAGRRIDREGLFTGWELVANEAPLSNHFFLEDYGLRRGDTLHAVVRRRDD